MGADYANARVGGMRSRLLGRVGLLELLAQPDLAARLELLRKSDYGEAVAAHVAGARDPLRGAERGLRARLVDDVVRLDRFLSGERVRPLFRAVLAFEDGWNLKTILRGIAAGEPPERLFPLLAPTPGLGEPALQELVRQRDVKGVIDLLATWGSSYAGPLGEALPAYIRRREPLVFEVALDRFLFARAIEAARRDGEDGRIILGLLETWVDLVNASTLLKLAGAGGGVEPEEFFVPGGRLLTGHRFRQYCALGEPALREALARDGRRGGAPGLVALAGAHSPFAADERLHRALAAAARRAARLHPLSAAVLLAFILDREAEIRRIRLVLRAAEFGLPADELLDLVGEEAAPGHPGPAGPPGRGPRAGSGPASTHALPA